MAGGIRYGVEQLQAGGRVGGLKGQRGVQQHFRIIGAGFNHFHHVAGALHFGKAGGERGKIGRSACLACQCREGVFGGVENGLHPHFQQSQVRIFGQAGCCLQRSFTGEAIILA